MSLNARKAIVWLSILGEMRVQSDEFQDPNQKKKGKCILDDLFLCSALPVTLFFVDILHVLEEVGSPCWTVGELQLFQSLSFCFFNCIQGQVFQPIW